MLIGNASTPVTAWRCNPGLKLHWRDWGSDSIAFEALSGQTVRLGPLAAAAIECLESAPCDLDRLIHELAGDLQITPDAEFRVAILDIIQHFERLGWLEAIVLQ